MHLSISFKPKCTSMELLEWMAGLKGITVGELDEYLNKEKRKNTRNQAEAFVDYRKDNGKLPNLLDHDTARAFKVNDFIVSYRKFGYYGVSFVSFEDGSAWSDQTGVSGER